MRNAIWAACAVFGFASAGMAQDYGSGDACSEVPLNCADAIAEAYISENMALNAQNEVRAEQNVVLAGLARMWARAGESARAVALIGRMDDAALRLETTLYAAHWLVDDIGATLLLEARQQVANTPNPSGEILAALAAAEAAHGNRALAEESLAKATEMLRAMPPSTARDLRIAIAKAHLANGAYEAAMAVMASVPDEPPEMQAVRHSFYADLVHRQVRAGQAEAAINLVDAIPSEFVRVAARVNLTVALLEGALDALARDALRLAISEAGSYGGTAYYTELMAALTGPAYLLLGNGTAGKMQAQALREMRDSPYETVYLNDLAVLARSLIAMDELVEARKILSEIERVAAPFTANNNQYGYNGMIAMMLLNMEDVPAAFAVLNHDGDARYRQAMLLRMLDNLPQRLTPVYSPGAYFYQ